MPEYKISDLFFSIQGEGYYAGQSAIFIRFYGCNRECPFCDESLHTSRFQTFSPAKLMSAISKFTTKRVVLTGGEPSLHNLNGLISRLKESGYYVCVETNGYKFSNIEEADWVTYSPKDLEDISQVGWDEIKFVVGSDTNVGAILDLPDNKLIFIQPEARGDAMVPANVKRCVALVKQFPHLRLSLQTHKLIGIK